MDTTGAVSNWQGHPQEHEPVTPDFTDLIRRYGGRRDKRKDDEQQTTKDEEGE